MEKVECALIGTPDLNNLSQSDMTYIGKTVRAETGLDIAGYPTRWVNDQANVGLAVDSTTGKDVVAKATEVFIQAAADRGIKITEAQVLQYPKGCVRMPQPKGRSHG